MCVNNFNMNVIDEVIKASEELFLEDDVENGVLEQLKDLWITKLKNANDEGHSANGTDIIVKSVLSQLDGNETDSDDSNASSSSSNEMSVAEEEEAEQLDDTEESLNSDDDLSEENLEDTDNVVICQYNKITRNRSRWTLELKNGVMTLDNKEFIFNQARGYTTW
ncbi:PREDICTED: transcription initiation factor IIA subunit 1-like [Nicrophorus vespilloides]|uniref:Transcription initiation factor IIA subunit 1-like n=1 Tax=Nicrophorus vespilloides TaxID=110193 RepID=A0ABM1MC95_NICVS|nr:PREDICTED: transcription initiation factor IIA subunit 1-like [Nicrophorus vespilloides]